MVAGVVANKHRQGGAVWTRLNWVLGLKRLGLDVHLVEQVASCACVDDDGRPAPFADSANLRSFTRVADRFGLTGRATLICEDGDESVGLSRAELRDVARDADALVNIGGHLTVQPLMDAFRRKAYVDLDPGYVQMWHAGGWSDRHLRDHDVHFSVGENLGRAGCTIPTGGIRWRPVRQPVVLDEWPLIPARDEPLRFTTVASWRGPYGPVHHGGRVYGSKVHEFRRFVELPGKVPAHFELALDIHPDETADLDLLSDHGWRLVRPHEVAGSPETFRDYVQGSGAEFSVAQGVYVHTGSGWFSDRTVRYLASGRPALVQDTGFSRNYPVGEGLLAFGTFDEAVAGAERIAADHARHCAAARALAETYFDSDTVLSEVLDQIQVPTPTRSAKGVPMTTTAPAPTTSGTSVPAILRQRAVAHPDRIASTFVVDGEGQRITTTYGDVDRSATAVAAHLLTVASPGDHAVLVLPAGPDFNSAFFGCLYAGIAVSPIAPPRPDQGLGTLVAAVTSSGATVALTTAASLDAMAASLEATPALRHLRWVTVDRVQPGPDRRLPETSPGSLAWLPLTSGSTGMPKTVMHTHHTLVTMATAVAAATEFTAESRVVSWLPPHFGMATALDLIVPLVAGCSTVVMPTPAFVERPARWLRLISEYEGTHSVAPNFAYDLCVQQVSAELRAGIDLSSWKVAMCGGEAVRPHTIDDFTKTFGPAGFRPEAFTACYGMTEGCLLALTPLGSRPVFRAFVAAELEARRVRPVRAVPGVGGLVPAPRSPQDARVLAGTGQVLLDKRCVVVAPETRTPCAPDEIGELWFAGGDIAAGYWENPQETKQTFAGHLATTGEGPFLRTGDLGFVHEGEVFITGRIKELVIIRGRNISPHVLETTAQTSSDALASSPGAAFSVDVDAEERLVVVQEAPADLPDPIGIADTIRRAVAETHEVQAHAVVLVPPGTIPKTAGGKVQRRLCRQLYIEHRLDVLATSRHPAASATSSATPTPLSTAAEREIAAVWAELLGLPQVGAHDNFFALGGDSLLSMQMVSRVRQAGWQVDVQQLLDGPTVAQLAAVARRSAPVTATREVVSGPVPLTPRQRRWLERVHRDDLDRGDVLRLVLQQPVDPDRMSRAVDAVIAQHDALRMRFHQVGTSWQQVNQAEEDQPVFSCTDLSTMEEAEQRQAVSDTTAQLRYGLDVERGPLMRVSLLKRGEDRPDLLLGVWNHLVMDAFSMRLVLEDLEEAYVQLGQHEKADLGPKTTSFKAWAERLEAYGRSGDVLAELPYWSDPERAAAAVVAIDSPPDRFAGSHLLSLDEEETDLLLHRVPQAWGVEINDVLLTALLQAFEPWTGRRSLLVDLVAHGRSPVFPDVDLSRTVGYLAAHFPMLLDLGDASGPVAGLLTVRDQLRQIPKGGIGYGVLRYTCHEDPEVQPLLRLPEPQVMFKYDGQFDQTFANSRLFDIGTSLPTTYFDPNDIGAQHLMVNPSVAQGRMHLIVRSGVVVHQRSTLERLASDYVSALRRIIATVR